MAKPSSPASSHHVWNLGLIYSLITVFSWSTLPLALAVTLKSLDIWTVTWFRMFISALLLSSWFCYRAYCSANSISWWQLVARYWPVLLLASLMLLGNYLFYLIGLDYTTAANAQVLVQLAPLVLALGGMFFFGERYNLKQWLGFTLLVLGLIVFFRNQLSALSDNLRYQEGVIWITLSAICWASYALLQKSLMHRMNAMQIMLFIYCSSSILLIPMSEIPSLIELNTNQWLWLIFCGLNTLVAYGSFGQAMHHWQASRVSAVIALTPLVTIVLVFIAVGLSLDIVPPEKLDAFSLIAAVLVVVGSMITSLAGQRKHKHKRDAIAI